MITRDQKILIIEDEEKLAQALKMQLETIGFETDVIHSGTDALEVIKRDAYDLILLDLMLPGVDGFEILEEMRRKDIYTPVIVTTVLAEQIQQARADRLGVVDYLVKSDLHLSDIVKKVEKFFTPD